MDDDPIEERIGAVEKRIDEHDKVLQERARLIENLRKSMDEMRATLGTVATKSDVLELRSAMEHQISGVLGSALNSVPAWQAAAWAGVAASIGIVALLHAIHII